MRGLMKTAITSILKTWVERLINDIIFQFGRLLDTGSCQLSHYCIGPLIWKTLLLQIRQLKAYLYQINVTVIV